MAADRPWVTVVRDPHDTPATRDLLARIDHLDRGVLVVRPVPGTRTRSVLALAVLAALGKQVQQRPRLPLTQWWPLARSWTIGHQVGYLVVDRAHTLPAPLIQDLLDLATATNATGVWFIDASPARTAPALAALPCTRTGHPQQLLILALAERDPPPNPLTREPHLPPVLPHAGFLHFRSACQQHLAPADAVLVDAAWERAYEATRRWAYKTDIHQHGRPDDRRVIAAVQQLAPRLSVHLAAALYTAAGPGEALVRLRAAQAALFRFGLLLHHEPRRATLPGQRLGSGHGLGCPLTPEIAATINRTVSTDAAAAATLELVYPLSRTHYFAARSCSWRVGSIDHDGSRLHTDDGSIPVPACGQPFLRAHLQRINHTAAAAPEQPLFDAPQRLDDLAQQALHPLNLRAPAPMGYRRHRAYLRGHVTGWMLERGLELSALADLRPRSDLMTSTDTS